MKYNIEKLLSENTYPGRGIIVGTDKEGTSAVFAYFIMGRSENSRNRIFEKTDYGIRTKAFDESKLQDPSLIIYNPYIKTECADIVTNGDQTDTIFEELKEKDPCSAFESALAKRKFEPDRPNFTPRISAMLFYDFPSKSFTYRMSILKSENEGETCCRFFYNYESEKGAGHFIHTYKCDGNPIPSFEGDPEKIVIEGSAAEFADRIWNSLNEDNKVSLIVKKIPLDGSECEEIIINKNK